MRMTCPEEYRYKTHARAKFSSGHALPSIPMEVTLVKNVSTDENCCPNSITSKLIEGHKSEKTTIVRNEPAIIRSFRERNESLHGREREKDDHTHKTLLKPKARESTILKEKKCLSMDNAERERRRKIMLQQRRMERILSKQSSVNVLSPSYSSKQPINIETKTKTACQSVNVSERPTPDESGNEAPKENFYDPLHVRKQVEDLVAIKSEKLLSRVSICTLSLRVIFLSLILQEVQQYCPYTSRALSFIVSFCHYHLQGVLFWINASFLQSGNVFLLRFLVELRWGSFFSIFCSDFKEKRFSWNHFLHLAFVIGCIMRGAHSSMALTCGLYKKASYESASGHCRMKYFLMLSSLIACWILVLPMFHEQKIYTNGTEYFFFIHTSADQIKSYVESRTLIYSPQYSLLDIMTKKSYNALISLIKIKIKDQILKEIKGAFINPFKFHGRLQTLFTSIRWAKFLAPLLGTCNKLRGNLLDMLQKKKQYHTSKTACEKWITIIRALKAQSKLEAAVLQLQKSFRERQERKTKRRMELVSSDRGKVMPYYICKRLEEERNISLSKLFKIEILDNQRQLRRQILHFERTKLSDHKEATLLQRKRLLLSPNTAFAVHWKYITVFCIIVEIAQMIFSPILSGELKKMPLDNFISVLLYPSCNKKKKLNAPFLFVPTVINVGDDVCTSSMLKQIWLLIVQIFSSILVPIVYTIFFLDVFITFFTGELNAVGKLVPKPFFTRYIVPGIGLQLIVNPTMLWLSTLVNQIFSHALHIGPSLSFHLCLTCLPLVSYIYNCVLDIIFEFVDRQNNRSQNFPNQSANRYVSKSGKPSWEGTAAN